MDKNNILVKTYARGLKISRYFLYVLISFLCICSFSEAIAAYFSASFEKVYRHWLNVTQISTIILSLLVITLLFFYPEKPNNLSHCKLFTFFLLIVDCVQIIWLIVVRSQKHLTFSDLSVSSSIYFIIYLIILTGETFSTALSLKRNKKKITLQNSKTVAGLFISSLAQIIGTSGFFIQNLTSRCSHSNWNYVILICFFIGIAYSLFLFVDDLNKLHREYFVADNKIDDTKKIALANVVSMQIV